MLARRKNPQLLVVLLAAERLSRGPAVVVIAVSDALRASLWLQPGVLADEVPVQLAHGLHVSVATGQPGLERLNDGLELGNPSS